MAHGKDAARDLVHGRRGGHWLPDDYEPVDFEHLPHCDRCGGQMACGQPGRHWMCCDECAGCHRPVGIKGENCHCNATTKKKAH